MIHVMRVDDDTRRTERSFTIFAFLWAAAVLFHQAQYNHWAGGPIEMLESCLAVVLLFRPASLRVFLTLTAFQLAQITKMMPFVPNHGLFVWIVIATIWLSAVCLLVAPSGRLRRATLFRTFAPIIRLELFVLYFFVVFQKLNTDYFILDHSCAAKHYLALAEAVPLLPTAGWAQLSNIYVTLGIETLIPILLVLSRTRMWGIVLGLSFHFLVGANGYYNFSSLLIALFFLFAPANAPDLASRLYARLRRAAREFAPEAVRGFLVRAWSSGVLLGPLAIALLVWAGNDWKRTPDISLKLWWPYGLGILLVFLAARFQGKPEFPPYASFYAIRFKVLAVPIGLLFLNGLSPHLGFKTETSFAMFSNLRTEAGHSNHFIIPVEAQIFEYQQDLVQILSTNHKHLELRASKSGLVPYYSVRYDVSQVARAGIKNFQLSYIYQGQRHDLVNAETHPELSRPYPLWLRKIMDFRQILDDRSRDECTH